MTSRSAIVAAARAWIGTPWVHQQRTRGEGVDCAGLIIGVARELGAVPPCFDFNGYARRPDGTLINICAKLMTPVPRASMQPGDVVVLATERDAQHMGFLGDYAHGGLTLIHAADRASGAGRVVEHRLMFGQRVQFRGAFALPGVA
jgi:cell wall-associated NlpC family hydrolase